MFRFGRLKKQRNKIRTYPIKPRIMIQPNFSFIQLPISYRRHNCKVIIHLCDFCVVYISKNSHTRIIKKKIAAFSAKTTAYVFTRKTGETYEKKSCRSR